MGPRNKTMPSEPPRTPPTPPTLCVNSHELGCARLINGSHCL